MFTVSRARCQFPSTGKPSISYRCSFRLKAFNWWKTSWLLLWSRPLTSNVSGHLWYFLTTDQFEICQGDASHKPWENWRELCSARLRPKICSEKLATVCKFCEATVWEGKRKKSAVDSGCVCKRSRGKAVKAWLHWLHALCSKTGHWRLDKLSLMQHQLPARVKLQQASSHCCNFPMQHSELVWWRRDPLVWTDEELQATGGTPQFLSEATNSFAAPSF